MDFAPGVGYLQQGLLAWGVDLQVLELQEAVQAAVLRHAAGQGGFAGFGPFVLVDADAALAGDADALQFAMGTVGVVECGAVGHDLNQLSKVDATMAAQLPVLLTAVQALLSGKP